MHLHLSPRCRQSGDKKKLRNLQVDGQAGRGRTMSDEGGGFGQFSCLCESIVPENGTIKEGKRRIVHRSRFFFASFLDGMLFEKVFIS